MDVLLPIFIMVICTFVVGQIFGRKFSSPASIEKSRQTQSEIVSSKIDDMFQKGKT